jgi:hypothetical protein
MLVLVLLLITTNATGNNNNRPITTTINSANNNNSIHNLTTTTAATPMSNASPQYQNMQKQTLPLNASLGQKIPQQLLPKQQQQQQPQSHPPFYPYQGQFSSYQSQQQYPNSNYNQQL